MAERNWGCRISADHEYKGLRTVVLQNDLIRVTVLADKGSDIVEFLHKPSDTDFMWWTPGGLQRMDKYKPGRPHSDGAFRDYYEGGWQDIFPSGGVANTHQGVDYGLHGESGLQPWSVKILKDGADEVAVELGVETFRSPFKVRKVLTLKRGVGALFIEESMTNLGETKLDAMWGHHPVFGAPFLSPDCRVDLAGATAEYHEKFSDMPRFADGAEGPWPRIKAKDGKIIDISRFPDPSQRSADMFYLKDLKANWYALTNTKSKVGFGMCWDLKTFPYLWFWQVYKGSMGPPSWGRNYNCALEPFSSIPSGLANAVARGTQLVFKPGQTRKTWLTAVAYGGKSGVKKIDRLGRVA